jgi:pimeloyl-ACP methyl ester carboxylesterase
MMAEDPSVVGLILFGSYCANDLSSSNLAVLSISGSDDGLSTPDKIADAAANLPADATFVEIDGANHASFGDYGVQPGDGTATISSEDMRDRITSIITTGT